MYQIKTKRPLTIFLFCSFLLVTAGCKKYLEVKPDKSLVVPNSIEDVRALLDANQNISIYSMGIGEASADNYYMTENGWESLYSDGSRSVYIWGSEIVYDEFPNVWSNLYRVVYYANLAIDCLNGIPKTDKNKVPWDNLMGAALFFRSEAFLRVTFTWAKAYDSTTAQKDLGIPLRLSIDFNKKSTRATIQQTYDQIIKDLLEAVPLLPVKSQHVMRPSRPAAYALLARVFLSMRNYEKAALYADSSLELYNTLIDFNDLNLSARYPISRFNPETIFYSSGGVENLSIAYARIDSSLYNAYDENDLRKAAFFRSNGDGSYAFKGSYDGSTRLFTGLATDEVYFIRSEANARLGNISSAISDLNAVLRKRWKEGTFSPFDISDKDSAESLILSERRKELLMRDLRWMDIKRLNKEGKNIVLKRILNGKQYVLMPNDNRYALPIPNRVIQRTNMKQN